MSASSENVTEVTEKRLKLEADCSSFSPESSQTVTAKGEQEVAGTKFPGHHNQALENTLSRCCSFMIVKQLLTRFH